MLERELAPVEAMRKRISAANRYRRLPSNDVDRLREYLSDFEGTPFRLDAQLIDEVSQQSVWAEGNLLRNYIFTHGSDYWSHPDVSEIIIEGLLEPSELDNMFWVLTDERGEIYADKKDIGEKSSYLTVIDPTQDCISFDLSHTGEFKLTVQFDPDEQNPHSWGVYGSGTLPLNQMTQEEYTVVMGTLGKYVQSLT